MKKVLILEDEVSIRSFVVINLKRAGYDTIEAGTGMEALERLRENPDVGVAILDIMLPDIDGFEVCRNIRATNKTIGIIMLTARTQEMDKVTGLMTGADDYVTKPFSPKEVAVRVKSVLRRTQGKKSSRTLVLGELSVNAKAYEVKVEGSPVKMTPREVELLAFLMERAGEVVSREDILDAVWGEDYYGDVRAVDTLLARVRSKISEYHAKVSFRTVYGVGYMIEERHEK